MQINQCIIITCKMQKCYSSETRYREDSHIDLKGKDVIPYLSR